MNFIELRVEDFIDEVLDSDSNENTSQIQILRKFAAFIDRETEVYSLGDLTEGVVLDFFRSLRNPQERKLAADSLNTFFGFLQGKGSFPNPPRLDADAVLSPRKPGKSASGTGFFEGDDDENAPRFKHRWDSE
ncbi:MAG: hypothetical protein KA419_17135 [Acidobacteria bacterium]|nr:hypothetical protein [Acidobacteriota bacterium]